MVNMHRRNYVQSNSFPHIISYPPMSRKQALTENSYWFGHITMNAWHIVSKTV